MTKNRGPKVSKSEMQAEAAAALAAFRSEGKAVAKMPPMVSRQFACSFCGKVSTIGARAGQTVRCPQCRTELANPA